MVDSVSSSSVAPVQPVSAPAPAHVAPQAPQPPAHAAAPTQPAALAGSVEQAKNRDFVYTLKDTDSGRVVVVVPHVELRSDGVRT